MTDFKTPFTNQTTRVITTAVIRAEVDEEIIVPRFYGTANMRVTKVVANRKDNLPWSVSIYGRQINSDGGFRKGSRDQPLPTKSGSVEQRETLQRVLNDFIDAFVPEGEEWRISSW